MAAPRVRRLLTTIKRADWPTFFRAVVKGVGAATGSIAVYGIAVWLLYRYMKRNGDETVAAVEAVKTGMQIRSQGIGILGATVGETQTHSYGSVSS